MICTIGPHVALILYIMNNSKENNMDIATITVLGFVTNHKDISKRQVLTEPKGKAIWSTKDKDGEATTFVRLKFVYGAYHANDVLINDKGIVENFVYKREIKFGSITKEISFKSDGTLDMAQDATHKHRHYNRFFTVEENLPKVGDVIEVVKSKLMTKQAKEAMEAYAEKKQAAELLKSLMS